MPYYKRLMQRLALACPIAALWLAGCAALREAVTEPVPAPVELPQGRDLRELTLQQIWVGRTRQELVRSFGPPVLVMGVPGNRVPDSIILVYKNKDSVNGCIDAFVVLRDTGEHIWNYFCR
jgi:hypothetical protein